jgi:acyl-CoA synthetase (AMP-forming)/AMP-acid ligase II
VALMTYTSGTTGLPKGAMLAYLNAATRRRRRCTAAAWPRRTSCWRSRSISHRWHADGHRCPVHAAPPPCCCIASIHGPHVRPSTATGWLVVQHGPDECRRACRFPTRRPSTGHR